MTAKALQGAGQRRRILWRPTEKGKLAARRGRKARGLEHEIARPPANAWRPLCSLTRPASYLSGWCAACRCLSRAPSSPASALAGLSSWLAVASAQAATVATCPSSAVSQPFLKWGDSNFYSLVAGGDFEHSPSEWVLSGGAQRAAGSEPYAVTGTLGAWSAALPPGASAQSPFTCVEPNERTFRFFARSEGTAATVLVQVVLQTPKGNVTSAGTKLTLKNSWEPSVILHTGAAVGELQQRRTRSPGVPLQLGQRDLAHRRRAHRPAHAALTPPSSRGGPRRGWARSGRRSTPTSARS